MIDGGERWGGAGTNALPFPMQMGEPNWIASCGNMEVKAFVRYQEKLAEMRKLDMEADWSSVKLQANGRRVAHWILED